MSAVTDELEKDAKWLRGLADYRKESEPEVADKFNRIAGNLEMVSDVMFTPSLVLEQKAERRAAEWIEVCLDTTFDKHEEAHLFLWLIQLRLQQGANKALLGQGLSGLGLGAVASMFAGKPKSMDANKEGE